MSVTMRQMLEAGVHFGHQTRYWNPKMAPYIFGHRNKIHIINLEKTLPMYQDAIKFVRKLASNKGTILFVGTKRQAREIVRGGAPLQLALCRSPLAGRHAHQLQDGEAVHQAPARDGGHDRRWHGGTHVQEGSAHLPAGDGQAGASLGGIKDMGGLPDAIFVIDVGYQKGAIQEAKKLGIPVIGVVDTNNSIDGVDYVIPGNDDSSRRFACMLAVWPTRSWKVAVRSFARSSATSSWRLRTREQRLSGRRVKARRRSPIRLSARWTERPPQSGVQKWRKLPHAW